MVVYYNIVLLLDFDWFYVLLYITGEIRYINVDLPQVVEVNQQTPVYIHLYDIQNDSYIGIVNISITSDSQSNKLQQINSPVTVKLSYSVSSIYKVNVTANNHISAISINFTVEVVRKSIHELMYRLPFCFTYF